MAIIVKYLDSKTYILNKLLEMDCVTWNPEFAKKHDKIISNVLTNEIDYDNISNNNKWGYQFHIKSALCKIDVDYSDIDSIKNMIIMNHFVIKLDSNKNKKYVTVNPTSVYEIFYYYKNKFKKSIDIWYDKEILNLKNLHEKLKSKNSQYSFFGIDEDKLNYFVNGIIHLQKVS